MIQLVFNMANKTGATNSKTTEDDEIAVPLIDPFARFQVLISLVIEIILSLFQNATIIFFAVILVVLGLLFLFFSLLGLT